MSYDRPGSVDSNFEVALVGETIASIVGCEVGSESIVITTQSGRKFELYHSQDCCESVMVRAVYGDPKDLVGITIQRAVEKVVDDYPRFGGSSTLTVFTLSDSEAPYHDPLLTVEWLGESNGYYSESVSFIEYKEETK